MKAMFVCGSGRSGTTVLRKALSHHPDVATMPGELRLNVDPDGVLDLHDALTQAWDPYAADTAMHRFASLLSQVTSRHHAYRGHRLDQWVGEGRYDVAADKLMKELRYARIPARWVGSVEKQSGHMYEMARGSRAEALRTFIETLYLARRYDATHWVDDSPYAGLHADRLAAVYPSRFFALCVRHPFDIFSSFLHGGKHWTPKVPKLAARRIREALLYTHSTLLSGHQYRVVRLEAVMENPIDEMLALCRDAQIFTPPTAIAEEMVSEYDSDAAHIGRWRAELSPGEIDVARDILGVVCQEFGYYVP